MGHEVQDFGAGLEVVGNGVRVRVTVRVVLDTDLSLIHAVIQ